MGRKVHGRLPGFGAALAFGALSVAGCIFPSFDEYRADAFDGGRTSSKEDESSPDAKRDASGSSSSSSSSASSSGSDANTTPDGPILPREVLCNGPPCSVDRQFCCVGLAPPVCIDNDSSEQCVIATFVHCDGKEDCPGDQVCCQPNGADQVTCQATCNGTVLCTGNGICPAPKSCTGTIGNGYRACQ